MEKTKILKDIETVFSEVFNNSNIKIDEQTCSKQIHEWDSLKNIVLISAIEKKFNIRFSIDDIYNAKNVGEICNIVHSKLKM